MGVIYVVLPLDHEIAHWLVQQGVDCPAGQSGRNPTVGEVRAALGEMADVRYHQSRGTGGDGWEIEVMDRAANGRWTSIRIQRRARQPRAHRVSQRRARSDRRDCLPSQRAHRSAGADPGHGRDAAAGVDRAIAARDAERVRRVKQPIAAHDAGRKPGASRQSGSRQASFHQKIFVVFLGQFPGAEFG